MMKIQLICCCALFISTLFSSAEASPLSQEELRDWRDAFNEYDVDKNGVITESDVNKFVTSDMAKKLKVDLGDLKIGLHTAVQECNGKMYFENFLDYQTNGRIRVTVEDVVDTLFGQRQTLTGAELNGLYQIEAAEGAIFLDEESYSRKDVLQVLAQYDIH